MRYLAVFTAIAILGMIVFAGTRTHADPAHEIIEREVWMQQLERGLVAFPFHCSAYGL
jgi:hypothetical protein